MTNKQAVNTNAGDQLTVYSSLPLQGDTAATSRAIVDGEKLALGQAGGEVGPFRISYQSLDDSSPETGQWDPQLAATNAQIAAQDSSAIAYLGDYDSGATAYSLPILNSLAILQISPASPYVGLTSSKDAAPDEPARFYPSGQRTFGRVAPGDQIEARALAQFMRQRGVGTLYVIHDGDPDALDEPLSDLVASDATDQGIHVLANDGVESSADLDGEVHKVLAAHPDAVFYSGGFDPSEGSTEGPVAFWHDVDAADPTVMLLGSSALNSPQFTKLLGEAAANTYLATPQLPPNRYPPLAQTFFDQFQRIFGYNAPPSALYGYEAMQLALQSIRDAGAGGNDRLSVIAAFYAIHDRNSVLGNYSVLPNGDNTLAYYAIDSVNFGLPVFARIERVAPER